MEKPGETAGTVLVAVPGGKGLRSTLAKHGFRVRACKNLAELIKRFDHSTDAIVLAQATLAPSKMHLLAKALATQPPWSDVPLILFAKAGSEGRKASQRALEILGDANVLRPSTSVANSRTCDRIASGGAKTSAPTRSPRFARPTRSRPRQYQRRFLRPRSRLALHLRERPRPRIDRKAERRTDRPCDLGNFSRSGRHRILSSAVIAPMETQQPDQFEVFYKPWGRWVDTRIYPSRDGLAIYRADISEMMEQQKRLRENEQRLYVAEERVRLALEAADVGTFDYYPAVGVIRWSDRCNELFGLPAGTKPDYITYLNAIHPDDRHIIHEPMREVLSPGSSGHYEIQYRALGVANSRERWLEEKGRVLLDDAGRPARFLGTILEITERKHAEDALKKAKQDAEEANRAKDQFLAMLSHELRTPLTPVLMTIASLQRNHDIPDSARRDLDVLRRNVELEALLIDDLLDLTRIAHGKLELRNDAIDVHASLSYALGVSASDLNEKQINVQQDLAAKEHHCWADAARLQQVFWNIIKNAVKFTPARGQLRISTRNDAEHYIIIDFTDTGIGINPELQPRIFDAFEQGGKGMTNRYGGLGLGLAISKRVIDLHGGKISVQSEGQGTGATFTIKLKAMETSLLEGPAYPLDGDGSARDQRGNLAGGRS